MIPLQDGATQIGVLGDTEGNQPWVFQCVQMFAEANIHTVLHLGDFHLGVGDPRSAKGRLLRTDKWLRLVDQTWLVTPGNHENWDRIETKAPGAFGLLWFGERIAFIPRGHRWTWAGVDFVSLGGAPSLNRANLTAGKTWWPSEQIAEVDVERVADGGPADVMLTHDAPDPLTPAVQRIIDRNPHGWSQAALDNAALGRDRLTRAFNAAQPRLLLHGHHHVHDRCRAPSPNAAGYTDIVSLAAAEMARSAALLRIENGPHQMRVELI